MEMRCDVLVFILFCQKNGRKKTFDQHLFKTSGDQRKALHRLWAASQFLDVFAVLRSCLLESRDRYQGTSLRIASFKTKQTLQQLEDEARTTEGKSESWTCNPRAISGFCRSNLPCDWVKKKSRTMVTKELSPLLNLMVLGRSPSTLLMRPLTKPSLSSPGLPPSLSKLLPK